MISGFGGLIDPSPISFSHKWNFKSRPTYFSKEALLLNIKLIKLYDPNSDNIIDFTGTRL